MYNEYLKYNYCVSFINDFNKIIIDIGRLRKCKIE